MTMSKNEYGLTDKQEEFAQQYVLLGYGIAAYEAAYNTSNMSRASCAVQASVLMKNPLIKARIAILKAELKDAMQVDQSFVASGYIKMMKECAESGDKKNYLKAADQLVKLLGMNAPDKLELGASGGFNINIVNPLKNNNLDNGLTGELQK